MPAGTGNNETMLDPQTTNAGGLRQNRRTQFRTNAVVVIVALMLNVHEKALAFSGLKEKRTTLFPRSLFKSRSVAAAPSYKERAAPDSYDSYPMPAGTGDDEAMFDSQTTNGGDRKQNRRKELRANAIRRRRFGQRKGTEPILNLLKANEEAGPDRWRRFPLRRVRVIGENASGDATLGDEQTPERATVPDQVEVKEQEGTNQDDELLPNPPSTEYSSFSLPKPSKQTVTSSLEENRAEKGEKAIGGKAELEENSSNGVFQDVVNDLTADLLSSERRQNGEDGDADLAENKGRNRRVTFFASKQCTRVLTLDEKYRLLLDEYMTLPLEQYSVKSFHDGGSKKTSTRRWLVRRLREEESRQYRTQYQPRDNHDQYMNDNGKYCIDSDGEERDRFFRLAVPLMPLIGLELTPVIDLEVIPASLPPAGDALLEETSDDSVAEESADSQNKNPFRRVFRRNALRRVRNGFTSGDPGAVRIQSLRVSLLSTEDEVQNLMRESRSPRPTAVSRNPSVRQIGNEAIGVVGKIEEWIQPHISFDATITWNAGHDDSQAHPDTVNDKTLMPKRRRRKKTGPSVTVKSTAVTSLTIPPLPVALPLPSGLLVKKIGSTLTKRALDVALPRFLGQLERDFERWANVDEKRE